MGTSVFKCPLCCAETFTCRKLLCDHLLSLKFNLVCTICSVQFDGISQLIDHLSNTNGSICSPSDSSGFEVFEDEKLEASHSEKSLEMSPEVILEEIRTPLEPEATLEVFKEAIGEKRQNNKDQISLRIKNIEDSLDDKLHNQRVTLIGDDNESHIIIVAEQSDSEDDVIERSFLEHEDGTIVLTSDKSDNVCTDANSDSRATQETGELYSCNSCSMSFTSVIDHIQRYHNDQDVVLEMTDDNKLEEAENGDGVAYLQIMNEKQTETMQVDSGLPLDKTLKYIITDSGEIVEAPEDDKHEMKVETSPKVKRKGGKRSLTSVKEESCFDKDGRQYIRRIIHIDKFWNADGKKTANLQMIAGDRALNESTAATVQVPQVSGSKSSLLLNVGSEPAVKENDQHLVLYQCGTCNYPLSSTEVKGHVCNTTPYKYVCPHCPVSYASSKSLCAHMKIHKEFKSQERRAKQCDTNSSPFKCGICDTVFPTNKSLRLHGRMHEPLRTRHVDGPVHYSSSAALRDENGDVIMSIVPNLDHKAVELKVPGEERKDMYLCQVCQKWIHCGYREIHENYHASGNQFNCEICNRKFFTEDNLMMHMNVHNNEKAIPQSADKVLPYQCLYCNRQFSRPHEKVKHERIHTGEKPHSCDICGKSFRVSYCLTLHMRTHTGARPYICGHCGKRFKAHSVYNHHLLTHSDVRAYKCCFCPKAFKTSVQLAGHKNSHTKPFSCTQCNRPFASLYAVRVHMETHLRQNNLKYRCALCGASYARAFALKDHCKSLHGCEFVPMNAKEIVVSEAPDAKGSQSAAFRKSLLPSKTDPDDGEETLSIVPKNENFIESEEVDIDCSQEMDMLKDSEEVSYPKKDTVF